MFDTLTSQPQKTAMQGRPEKKQKQKKHKIDNVQMFI